MALTRTAIHAKNCDFAQLFRIQMRCFAKYRREQDPDEVKQMPIFQYATENTKRRKRIYMWGSTLNGALGSYEFIKLRQNQTVILDRKFPWRSPFGELHKVRDIACGFGFTVFAASNKEDDFSLFGVGLNTDFQIGFHCRRQNIPLEIVAEPVPIALPLFNSKTKAIKVACGRAHTVVLTDKEGVFSLGNNSYGQCGVHSKSTGKKDLIKVNKMEGIDEEISEVFCGQDHTLLLSASGKVYSCGWGADGQTGLGNYENQFTPSLVKGDIENEQIVHLACTADCVLAVSSKGDVFGWGNSEYRQLNLATEKQQINVPTHLNLNVGKVLKVASGGTMCAVLNERGNVYVWGYGILGQGPNVSSSKVPVLLPEPLFGANEFNTDVKVSQIVCGLSHFAAITNYHHLYMWGKNRSYCLGLGKQGDQYFPFKVPVPCETLKVTCGVDHTAVLCRGFT